MNNRKEYYLEILTEDELAFLKKKANKEERTFQKFNQSDVGWSYYNFFCWCVEKYSK